MIARRLGGARGPCTTAMGDSRLAAIDLSDRFPPIEVPAANPPPITVASILDEFSDWCFRYEANLVLLFF